MLKPLLCAAAATVLIACTPAGNAPAAKGGHDGHGAAMDGAKPPPDAPALTLSAAQTGVAQAAAINQVVTVALPVDLARKQAWVSGSTSAELGPFMFHGLEENPGAGPGGADLVVFTYMAHESGAGVLKFARVPAGASVIGPDAKPEAALERVEFPITAQ